ncbi:hypothetical protein PGB90_006588 [Kerria lacca]
MNFMKITLVTISCFVVLFETVLCQFDDFNGFLNDFQSPSVRATRDPRQNRGPVLFPQAPIGPETSGVRVGASGFGFVPPNGRGRILGAIGGPNVENEFVFW